MGTTPKPLTIVVTDPAMMDWPEIAQLVEQGHKIGCSVPFDEPVAYLGPNCWRTLDAEYLDVTIKSIRKEVYEVRTPKPGSDDPKRPTRARKRKKPVQRGSSATSPDPSGTVGG